MSSAELSDRFAAAVPVLAAEAPRLLAASRFLRESIARLLDEQADLGGFTQAEPEAVLRAQAEALLDAADETSLMQGLRRLRRLRMVRIAVRDLGGLAELDETLGELSSLGDACVDVALRFGERQLQARHGVPHSDDGGAIRPVVLGMGKLGGRELNFSSDIDLIFCHTASGETDGARPLSSDEYFAKLAQLVQRVLAQPTADGFVFRVDLMLRPFGSAGALSASFTAIEEYYLVHGREWERYALIKARPIAGDLDAGTRLLDALRPFVYRRYLDYTAIGSLRALKRMIADDVARRGKLDDIKLGSGGIRELEFIVQSFQLVRGGAERALRDTRLRPVLRHLGGSGHLDPEVAQRLDEAYVFLRRVENAIQIYADQQTHALPTDEEPRKALCAALAIDDWATLRAEIDRVRSFVQQQFEAIFAERGTAEADGPNARLMRELWFKTLDGEPALEALNQAGFIAAPALVVQAIDTLRSTRLVRAMNDEAQLRLQLVLGALADEALRQDAPDSALVRALSVVQAIAGRSTYLSLLHENANARAQLVRLCAASPWLTEFIARAPMLLDVLLDTRTLYAPPDRQQLRDELAARCADLGAEDTERGMDVLRRYHKEMTLRIAAADLSEALPLVKVSDRLTWLAEALVDQALQLAWQEMRAQYGEPLRADGQVAGFAVIGYGKFGGLELGYGSDLDLVFIHDCDQLDADTVGGGRAINAGVFYSRLAQRLINWLATQTPAGRVYEIDMELRPNGKSGLMVTSLASFAAYQRDSAWTWEHQALTRARPVAGSASIGAAFEAVRREVLMRPREAGTLRREIAEMRAKMRASLDKSTAERWDLKQGAGGLIDIEFITQYFVLRDAHRDARLVEFSDNWRQLDALAAVGSVDAEARETLIRSYRRYRAYAHAAALQNAAAFADPQRFAAERTGVEALWTACLETAH